MEIEFSILTALLIAATDLLTRAAAQEAAAALFSVAIDYGVNRTWCRPSALTRK